MADGLIYEEAGFSPLQFQQVFVVRTIFTALGLICVELRNESHTILAVPPGSQSK